jgi:hypothetical protein
MAQQPPAITFEDIPLDEARRIGRGPRMDPALYQAIKEKIQSLDNTASRFTIPEGTSLTAIRLNRPNPYRRLTDTLPQRSGGFHLDKVFGARDHNFY